MTGVIQQPCKVEDAEEVESGEYALIVSLLSHLECPVCYEVSEPPIYTCRNGHNVCHACQKHMKECATCRTPGRPDIRNRFAEQTHAALTVPCANADRGCKARTLPQLRDDHALRCGHAPLACVLCPFAGALADLLEHLQEAHPEVEQVNLTTQLTRKVPLETYGRTTAIIHDGALFCFYESYDDKTNAFTFQLFKSGPGSAQESEYFCAIRFTSSDLLEKLSFRYPVPYAAEFAWENERGVAGNTLNLLANEGTLKYVLSVSHRDEEKDRIASKIKTVTSGQQGEEDGQAVYLFMMPLLFFFIVGCLKGWWQTLLSWH